MPAFNLTCPHCNRAVTITDERRSISRHELSIPNASGPVALITSFYVCPNQLCRKPTLTASLLGQSDSGAGRVRSAPVLQNWSLIPPGTAKQFPDYIPAAILEDYNEACLIRELSPKASATLARRCLQGMLRDFWSVRPGKLANEIKQIEDRVEQIVWDAIQAVRTLGNIGAHMEHDINVIVDVDVNEAQLLIGLVETLLEEWYVRREERERRMRSVIDAASGKKQLPPADEPPVERPSD